MGLLLAVPLVAPLSGCARFGQNAQACSIKPADVELAKTARRACGGSVNALMILADAYEHGKLVVKNEQLAIELYRSVSFPKTTPKNTYIYVPAAGKVAGYTMPIQTGTQTVPGHAEAQFRLGMMLGEGRGQRRDTDMALYCLRMAAAQGHEEASKRLIDGLSFMSAPGAAG